MRVKDNPFYVLGVTPYDTLETINEKYDEKSFMDEDNEIIYDNARQILCSPNKRLAAEVRWFYELDLEDCIESELEKIAHYKDYSIDDFKKLNDDGRLGSGYLDSRVNILLNIEILPYIPNSFVDLFIEELDSDYMGLTDTGSILQLEVDIDECRRRARIPLCNDFNLVEKEVKTLIEDVKDALNSLFSRNQEGIIRFTNTLMERIVDKNADYGQVIEYFISTYAVHFKEELDKYKRKIFDEVNYCKENCSEEFELNELCDLVRRFDYIAQPIQLLLRDRGQADLQKQSVDVANEVRDLALYYNNEEGNPELSIKLLNLEMELFSELPSFYNTLESDKEILEKLIKEKKKLDYIHKKLDELEDKVIHLESHSKLNKSYLSQQYQSYLDAISYVQQSFMDVNVPDNEYEANQTITAIYYKTLGTACTWSDMWEEALECYHRAFMYAFRTHNTKLKEQIDEGLTDIRKTINNLKRKAEDIAAKEKMMQEIYYEGEWGLVFKEKVKISQYGLEYKDKRIPLSEIRRVLWGAVKKSANGIPTGTDYCIEVCSANDKITIHPNRSVYSALTERIWKATASQIITNILTYLKNGQVTVFGRNFHDDGIHYKEKKWFSKDIDRFYRWNEIKISHGNGTLDFVNSNGDLLASYSYLDTHNVHMLEAIVDMAKRKRLARLSDLL